jgi:uncharacterized protein (DUF488 family)
MTDSTIYSIGHGNKKIEDFINELKSFNILFLLDVRSKPFSKWSPHFNQNQLETELTNHNIKYVFVGDSLGGLRRTVHVMIEMGKLYMKLLEKKNFSKKA